VKFFVGLVVIGMLLLFLPTTAIFSDPSDSCDNPISVELRSNHSGKTLEELESEDVPEECDLEEWTDDSLVTGLGAGEVAYHLVLTSAGDADGAFLDSNENGSWDTGEPIGTKQGSNFDWEIKGGTTTDSWEVVVCGLDPGQSYDLDLKVSHFCEGTGGLGEGKFRITKYILGGALDNNITFQFNINPELSANPNPISVTIPAGSTSESSGWFTVPADGTSYTITEVNIPSNWQLESSNNISFSISSDGQEETAEFTDEMKEGCLTISKSLEGDLPETGSYTFLFDIYNVASGGTAVLEDISITIDLPATTDSTTVCNTILVPGTDYWVEETDSAGMLNTVPGSGNRIGPIPAVASGAATPGVAVFKNDPNICEGRLTVVKTINGQTPSEGSFDFYIQTPSGAQRGPFTLNSDNGYSMSFDLPCGEGYSLWESNVSEGYEFNSLSSNAVTNANIDGSTITFDIEDEDSGQITIDNKVECQGKITVIKLMDGRTPVPPTEGSFNFYIQTPSGAQRGPFTLNSDNGYSMSFDLPCARGYSLWEDEENLPDGIVFSRIRSTVGTITGNRVDFGVGPDTDGTIALINEEVCTGEVTVTKSCS